MNAVKALCWKAKPIRGDAVSASLASPITVPFTTVDPWSPLRTQMQNFTHGTETVRERKSSLCLFTPLLFFILYRTDRARHQQANHETMLSTSEVMINSHCLNTGQQPKSYRKTQQFKKQHQTSDAQFFPKFSNLFTICKCSQCQCFK